MFELWSQRGRHVVYPLFVFTNHHVVDEPEIHDVVLELVLLGHVLFTADGAVNKVL